MAEARPALLVAHSNAIAPSGGGVQVCHREYAAALGHAGFALRTVTFDHPDGLGDRIMRRLFPRASNVRTPPRLADRVEAAIAESGAQTVFFAFNVFPSVSRRLRRSYPGVMQVLLSYGIESIDFCIEQQLRRRDASENRPRRRAERLLGRQILDEAEERRGLDAVLTLSPLEADFERWLGSTRVLWVPRAILEPRLQPRPVDGRVGCVSTLDHPPNLDGLARLFAALDEDSVPPGFRFRLVGGPRAAGEAIAARHRFVEYLGRLDDAELRAEAATWCCFVHPLFVQAKGCSTKLGVALGRGLPIATTRLGARGYAWDGEAHPLPESPAELARAALTGGSLARFGEGSAATARIVQGAPSLAAVGAQVRDFLLSARSPAS